MLFEPLHIATPGMHLNQTEKFNNLGLKARLAGVRIRNDRVHFNGDYKSIRANQSRPSNAFAM